MSNNYKIYNMVAIDTRHTKIKRYDPDNIYNETTVVEKSEFLQVMKRIKSTGYLPVRGKKIGFIDDVWDFTGTLLYVTNEPPKFNFQDIVDKYKDIVKYYIFLKIVEGDTKLSTIKGYLNHIKDFLDYIDTIHIPLYNLTPYATDDYINALHTKRLNINTINKRKEHVKDFLISFSEYNENFNVSDFKRSLLFKDYSKELKAAREDGKTPNIPKAYFNDFVKGLLDIIKTEKGVKKGQYNGNTSVSMACILLIASQIGVRTGELLMLKSNTLDRMAIKDPDGNDIEAYILNFESWKTAEFDGEVVWVKTVLNEISKYAYDTLLELYAEKRKDLNSNFLFMTDRKQQYPLADSTFHGMYMRFLTRHADVLKCINIQSDHEESLSGKNIGDLINEGIVKKSMLDWQTEEDDIYYPVITQFRVHVISSLIEMGVPLQYVKEMMGHLYAETTEGYYRLSEEMEKPNEITALYEDIAVNDIRIIGPFGKEYNDKIKEFLKEYQGENVHLSFKEIAEKVAEVMPTRLKELGACIKPTFSRDCAKDAAVDEFYCAYGVCQYIHHTFFMVGKTFNKYHLLLQSYNSNKYKGFTKCAQKDKFLLENLIKDMLLPELEELNIELERNGASNILVRYPELDYIIENVDDIILEVKQCLQ